MIPGSARNWIAVNAVQQSSLNKNEPKNMATLQLRNPISRFAPTFVVLCTLFATVTAEAEQ
jgi:hypothetical protein